MTDQRIVLMETFSEESVGDLRDAYEGWRQERDEETFLDWRYEVDGGTHNLVILYTE